MEKQYFQVRNWDKFQAYNDGRPIHWIKLYNELLEDPEFSPLPDSTKWHVIGVWLLASRTKNKMLLDNGWVAKQLCSDTPIDLDNLIMLKYIEPCKSVRDRTKGSGVSVPRVDKIREDKKHIETPAKAARKKEPGISECLKYFGEKYKALCGLTYPAVFGKDYKLLNGPFKLYGVNGTLNLIDIFFERVEQEPWLKDKVSVGMFHGKLPQLVQQMGQEVKK